jgi:hypothetical protein
MTTDDKSQMKLTERDGQCEVCERGANTGQSVGMVTKGNVTNRVNGPLVFISRIKISSFVYYTYSFIAVNLVFVIKLTEMLYQ